MTISNSNTLWRRRAAWLTLVVMALIGLAMVVLPVWIIMPFKPQSERGLALSYALRRWSPLFTLVALAASLALIAWLWRGSRWWRKAALVVVIIPLVAAAWFARQNHFEWMFHPAPNPAYAKINAVEFVADTDMVMAVESNGEAVAYPIRLMAYHHVVQDIVGGKPVVATY